MEALYVRVMRALGPKRREVVKLALQPYEPTRPQHGRYHRADWLDAFEALDRHVRWIAKALAKELKAEGRDE